MRATSGFGQWTSTPWRSPVWLSSSRSSSSGSSSLPAATTAVHTASCWRSAASPISRRSRSSAGVAEQRLECRVVWVARWPDLAPRALLRLLVVAEAQEARAVPEAVALHLVVAHFRDELRPHRRLGELTGAPAVRFREAPVGRAFQQRLDPREDLVVLARGDGRRADVIDLAVVAVQTEQQRRDPRRLLLPANADDHAVGGLERLHLQHAVARARQVRQAELLRDYSVQAGRLEAVEPALRDVGVERGRREPEAVAELLDLRAALLERFLVDRLAVPEQHVEDDEFGRDLRRELADARLGRVPSRLHRVEVEHAVARDHDLPVEGRVRRQQLAQRPQLGEVAQERALVARPERKLGAVVL